MRADGTPMNDPDPRLEPGAPYPANFALLGRLGFLRRAR
jgi:hypothetical protein